MSKKQISHTTGSIQSSGRRSYFNFRNCCLSCLVLLILLIIGFLIIIALTGVVKIPIISPIFYGDGPKPTRVVSQQDVSLQFLGDLFKTTADQNKNEVIVSEEVLTYYINYYANSEKNILVPENERSKGNQLAVEDGYAQLFIRRHGSKIIITADISVEGNKFVIEKIKIGKLRVPVFLANWYLKNMLNKDTLSSMGFSAIRAVKGQLYITIDPQYFKNKVESEIPPLPFPSK